MSWTKIYVSNHSLYPHTTHTLLTNRLTDDSHTTHTLLTNRLNDDSHKTHTRLTNRLTDDSHTTHKQTQRHANIRQTLYWWAGTAGGTVETQLGWSVCVRGSVCLCVCVFGCPYHSREIPLTGDDLLTSSDLRGGRGSEGKRKRRMRKERRRERRKKGKERGMGKWIVET